MKNMKILNLDLSSPTNFISIKKIKRRPDDKISLISSWIREEQDSFDILLLQGKEVKKIANRIAFDCEYSNYSAFFAEKANTGILIDKTFSVVGYSNFSNVGNLVVVSTDDNQYLNFLSVYLTNTSSLKSFFEYYDHLIFSDKTGKTSMIVGGVFPSLSSIRKLTGSDYHLIDSCFDIDQSSSSVRDDTERILTSPDIITSDTYRGLGMVLEKVLMRSPIATKISR